MDRLQRLAQRQADAAARVRACEAAGHDDRPTDPQRLGDATYRADQCRKCRRIRVYGDPLTHSQIIAAKHRRGI